MVRSSLVRGTPHDREGSEMNIPKAIRVAMEEADLSVNGLSEKTNWSVSYICNCRAGRADPQARLTEWAEELGLAPSELLARAERYK